MEENFKRTMDDFAPIWQRVCGFESPTPPDEDALLRRFIRDAYCDSLYYSSLSRMFPAGGRNLLLGHAQEAKNRCRLLRAEYFIRTGEAITPKENGPLVGGKLASLRAIMCRETAQSEEFRRVAEEPVCESIRALCIRFAEEADRRALADRALLLDCF